MSRQAFRLSTRHHPQQKIYGYVLDKIRVIPEFQMTVKKFTHISTGAQHLHVDRDDDNSVFGVAFTTAPNDSTGVPHILEHTTLCGSKRYPVRDPFFKMLNRSLATYMNAWTCSDFTMYPFATENRKDMENLRSVYTDSVFFPLLSEMDFLQEGWRLEHSNVQDKDSKPMFKGVVYNEMKGAFSDVGSLFCTRLQQHLYPDSTYAHVSGGDPAHIPDLTYEQLCEFHRQHYHPSNAKFYTYGKYPVEKHLEYLDGVFQSIGPLQVKPSARLVSSAFNAPKRIHETCPPDPMGDAGKQSKISVAFQLKTGECSFENFVLRLLGSLLIDGQSSPFYRSLIESELGAEYSPGTGMDSSTQDPSFSVGLQGVAGGSEEFERIEQVIMDTLQQVATTGFTREHVEAAIHQLELSLRDKSANFGMELSHPLMSDWMHGREPTEALEIREKLRRLRSELSRDEKYLQHKVSQYFLNNPHRLTFSMSPSPDFNSVLQQKEQENLNSKLASQDKAKIFSQGLQLSAEQDSKQGKLEDIAKETKIVPFELQSIGALPLQTRFAPTNELVYFRAALNYGDIDDISMLPLFTSTFASVGTLDSPAAEFDQKVRLSTGGISCSLFHSTSPTDVKAVQRAVCYSGVSLERNSGRMFELIREALLKGNYENLEKLKTITTASYTNMMNSLAQSGHAYARLYASSLLCPTKYFDEKTSGISQIRYLDQLVRQGDYASLAEQLKAISDNVSALPCRLAITASDKSILESRLQSELLDFSQSTRWRAAVESETFSHTALQQPTDSNIWIPTPFATNYTANCISTVPYDHPDSAALQLLGSLLTNHYLHKVIREKNGAYGGGASYSPLDGIFSFYSYRDPNPLLSLESFNAASLWAGENMFTNEQITEAKLSVFRSIDAPVSVSAEGMAYFKTRLDHELRQRRRERLLAVDASQLKQVAERYLIPTVVAAAGAAEQRKSFAVVLAGDQMASQCPDSQAWLVQALSTD